MLTAQVIASKTHGLLTLKQSQCVTLNNFFNSIKIVYVKNIENIQYFRMKISTIHLIYISDIYRRYISSQPANRTSNQKQERDDREKKYLCLVWAADICRVVRPTSVDPCDTGPPPVDHHASNLYSLSPSYIPAYAVCTLRLTNYTIWSDVNSGSASVLINEVELHWAQLVLGWVTVSEFNSRCRTFFSVCNQLPQLIPSWVGTMSTGQRVVMPCSGGVKKDMVHVWVAGKTVWSLVTHGPYVNASETGIIKRYIKWPSLLFISTRWLPADDCSQLPSVDYHHLTVSCTDLYNYSRLPGQQYFRHL